MGVWVAEISLGQPFFFYLIATLGATCIVVVISGKEIQAAAIQSRFSRLPVSINATQLRERSQVGAQSGAECGGWRV